MIIRCLKCKSAGDFNSDEITIGLCNGCERELRTKLAEAERKLEVEKLNTEIFEDLSRRHRLEIDRLEQERDRLKKKIDNCPLCSGCGEHDVKDLYEEDGDTK